MVEPDNFSGDRKSQPEVPFGAPGFFCTVKTVENLFPVIGSNPDAGIGDRQIKAVLFVGKRKGDVSALRGVADGIVKQDGEKLDDAVSVRGAQRQ